MAATREAAEPEINLLRSDALQVTFTVGVPGFYYKEIAESGVAYRRLSLPGCGVTGAIGSPELPTIVQRIAVPQCDNVYCTIQVTATETLPGYTVYPVPELQEATASGGHTALVEVFTCDPAAYSQNAFLPGEEGRIAERGALREQHFVALELYPLQYNPVTQTLQIATELEVTLTFDNPSGAVNMNTGIFNNVAAHALLNYESSGMRASANDKAFEKEGFEPGRVQWITLTDTLQVDTLRADYLIICAAPFFEPENEDSELLRLARYRARYNGFDVAILNAENIISDAVGFYYEGNPLDPDNWEQFKKEQRLRSCIRKVYEGGRAHHTYDGRLGYVLLVGDVEAGNGGMPSSYQRADGIGLPDPSDYYFSCITRQNGIYDGAGDLYIGRFCVPNNLGGGPDGGLTRLRNMVEKTIFFESEYSFGTWRNNLHMGNGDDPLGNDYWDGFYYDEVASFLQGQQLDYINIFRPPYAGNQPLFRQALVAMLNQGAPCFVYGAHGNPDGWVDGLSAHFLMNSLDNGGKTPFCITRACSVGDLDHSRLSCLAEQMTAYAPDKGFVAMIASSSLLPAGSWAWGRTFDHCALYALYNNLSHIAGEIFLEAHLAHTVCPGAYILFGDPALNSMAQGFEITRPTVADSKTVLSCPVRVHQGASLTIPDNGKLFFGPFGRLTVEKEGSLRIKGGAEVFGEQGVSSPAIQVKGGGFITEPGVVFHQVNTLALEGGRDASGQMIYDYEKEYLMTGITFRKTPLRHLHCRLNLDNCSFNSQSHLTSIFGISRIDGCTFDRSGFFATGRSTEQIPFTIDMPYPSAEITHCHFSHIWQFAVGNDINNHPVYSKAAVRLDDMPEFIITGNTIVNASSTDTDRDGGLSVSPYGEGVYLTGSGNGNINRRRIADNTISKAETGIFCYNSKAAVSCNTIYGNTYGVRLFNNSQTSFWGNASGNARQVIRDNLSYELYASSNSFPHTFTYNQIIDEDNAGAMAAPSDPLIYCDRDSSLLISFYYNIAHNHWGDTFNPAHDLYPASDFIYLPFWTPRPGIVPSSPPGETLYNEGINYFSSEQYGEAQTTFLALLEEYPASPYAVAALHELFALEQFLDNDYETLRDFYRETDYILSDSLLSAAAAFLATRCAVRLKNWQPAVDWYEERIADPPGFQDSIFAVIDLGAIHLLMEEDTAFLKRGRIALTRLPQLIPESKVKYEQHKSELLALLPKSDKEEDKTALPEGQKGMLLQNSPNPAHGTATIGYGLAVEGEAVIAVYNLLGQPVKRVPLGRRAAGSYRAEVSLAGLTPGTYLYTLIVDGQRTDTKKLVKR